MTLFFVNFEETIDFIFIQFEGNNGGENTARKGKTGDRKTINIQ